MTLKQEFFKDATPLAKQVEAEIYKWSYIKLRSNFFSKEIILRLPKHTTDWEKLFAHHLLDKGLISEN